MDHRQGFRKTVSIDAVAESASCGPCAVRIVDVSLTGVYVEGAAVGDFSKYAPLSLHFRLELHDGTKDFRWRGFVVRLGHDGAGAVFESSDPMDQSGLLALLMAADDDSQDVLDGAS
jgi:hypothetical protein